VCVLIAALSVGASYPATRDFILIGTAVLFILILLVILLIVVLYR